MERGTKHDKDIGALKSTFRTPRSALPTVPRVGIEPTLPARAAALQAAWRPTARPKA